MVLPMSSSSGVASGGMSSGQAALIAAQMSQIQTSGQIAARVARKALDTQQEQGQGAIELLQNATEFAKGTASGPRAGLGADGRLDVTA